MVVDVGERVAGQVVARVELLAGGAAPDRLLLGGLDLLGAGEQATRRDAVVDERLVVAAAVERGVVVGLADQRVVRLEEVLDRRRPVGTDDRRRKVDWSPSYTMKM